MELLTSSFPPIFERDIQKAVSILKNAGCSEIYIFGSLVKGDCNDDSDIDIAVNNLAPGKFFEVSGLLMLELEHSFDLIKLDDKKSHFSNFIKENEVLLRVA